jgi:exonuclease III
MGHRIAEVVELAGALEQIEIPAIVVGDFNFTEREPEYKVLKGLSGLTDVAAALERREETIIPGSPYRTNERPPGVRIDYVFTRDGVERTAAPHTISRVLDETIEINGNPAGYSDHAGLLAEINLDNARPSARGQGKSGVTPKQSPQRRDRRGRGRNGGDRIGINGPNIAASATARRVDRPARGRAGVERRLRRGCKPRRC